MSADPADVQARPHFVYRVYNAKHRLLYVGCTSNLEQRKRDHRGSAWWASAHTWKVDGPFDYATGRAIELAAIHAERPRHNRTGLFSGYLPVRPRPVRSAA